MSTFGIAKNDLLTALGAAYTAGSGSMTLATGAGASWPVPTPTAPVRFTVITAATFRTAAEVKTIFEATGRTGDVLSGVAAVEGTTDRNYAAGAWAEHRPTFGFIDELQDAVLALEAGGGVVIGGPVAGGTAARVLFVAAGPVLAQSSHLTFNDATETLTLGASVGSGVGTFACDGDLEITAASASVVLKVGAATVATFTAAGIAAAGAGLTALNASNLASGTVGTARLGSGTADSTTFLRGDQTWAAAGADLSAAAILAPATSARNVVQPTGAAVIPLVVRGAASQTANLQEWQDSGGNVLARIGPTNLGTGQQRLYLTGDVPSGENGALFNFSTSGAGGTGPRALSISFAAGYTGGGTVGALEFDCAVAGTSAAYSADTVTFGYRPEGNRGAGGYSRAVTAGVNTGVLGLAGGGGANHGGWFAATATKASVPNIGVVGAALNAGAGSTQTGVLGTLRNQGSAPTVLSAAGCFDNGAETSHVLAGLDNGTLVFAIADGGLIRTNQAAAATTPGTVTKKIPVYDTAGNLLGYLALYDAIT